MTRVSQGWTWIESWANFFLFYMLILDRESPKKYIIWLLWQMLPGKICLRSSAHLQRSICVWIKSVKNDFSIESWQRPFSIQLWIPPQRRPVFGASAEEINKDVVDGKRSRRKGEREEIKSLENREFEQCAEVEFSENEPRKTDQAMGKIIKALTTDEKKTPKNVQNRSSSGGGRWKSHLRKPLLVAR